MLPNCNKQLCHFWNYLFLYIKNEDWHLNFDFKNLKKKCKLFYDEYLVSKFKKSWILCWGGGWIVVRDLSFTTTTTYNRHFFLFYSSYIQLVWPTCQGQFAARRSMEKGRKMLHLFGVVSKAVVLSNFRAQSNVESLTPLENGIFIIKTTRSSF